MYGFIQKKSHTAERLLLINEGVYLHIYYNDQKAADDKSRFNAKLERLENNLVYGTYDVVNEKLYQKYFNQ